MIYFDADARDGRRGSDPCQPCCCKAFSLRPGETNMLVINYAPWSVPIPGCGLVAVTAVDIEKIGKTCPDHEIDGFKPPSVASYQVSGQQGEMLEFELSHSVQPAGNDFIFEHVALSGPYCGEVCIEPDGCTEYTPASGFEGYDYFSYRVTDPQGREIIRTVEVKVGRGGARSPHLLQDKPYFHVPRAQYNAQAHTVSIPVYMPLNTLMCERTRATIKQRAQDCHGNCYEHFMCFDISVSDC